MDAEFGMSNGMVKILGIQKGGTSPAVRASAQALKDESYPILQPLYFYWGGSAARKDV
jgi:ABC-type phosphate transport system substrate-binding protein